MNKPTTFDPVLPWAVQVGLEAYVQNMDADGPLDLHPDAQNPELAEFFDLICADPEARGILGMFDALYRAMPVEEAVLVAHRVKALLRVLDHDKGAVEKRMKKLCDDEAQAYHALIHAAALAPLTRRGTFKLKKFIVAAEDAAHRCKGEKSDRQKQ